MKYRICFIVSLLYFNISFGQIPKNFFVDDADGVDFIQFEFYVNDEAKIVEALSLIHI